MSNIATTLILSQRETEYGPSDPGGPNYIGAIDYPKTVYRGYIGSTNYTYEPRAAGYNVIDTSNVPSPVAKMPKSDKFKKINIQTKTLPVLGECTIPSYFQTSEDIVRRCNENFSVFIFQFALALNLVAFVSLYQTFSIYMVGFFILFHIVLYYFLKKVYVNIVINEWNTVQKYKQMVKKNKDFSMFDSPTQQFNSLSSFMMRQAINRQTILYGTIIISILFVWIPLWIQKTRT